MKTIRITFSLTGLIASVLTKSAPQKMPGIFSGGKIFLGPAELDHDAILHIFGNMELK